MYAFVQEATRPPHACHTCGGHKDREWFLDLGEHNDALVTVPTIYICNLCFTAIAKEQGLVDSAPLVAENKQLQAELFDATVKAESLELGLVNLIRARFLDGSHPDARELVGGVEADVSPDGGSEGARADDGPGLPDTGEQSPPANRGAPESSTVPNLGAVRPGFSLDAGST